MFKKLYRYIRRLFIPYGLIVGEDLKFILEDKILLDYKLDAVQDTSVDVSLNEIIFRENIPDVDEDIFIVGENTISMRTEHLLTKDESAKYLISKEFILGSLKEYIKLPKDIYADFTIRSKPARGGLDHSIATPINPGWEGYLRLELTNGCLYHKTLLWAGMPIGTLRFYKCKKVKGYKGKMQNQMIDSIQ